MTATALPVDATLGLIARVAEALQSIHAAGVIHRDLKPSNVILTAEGPKVIDFGIARAADLTSITGTGVQPGTPAYMAPEHILGKTLTPAADIFALGIVAHFAATGELAFGGGSIPVVIHRITEQEPNLDGCPELIRTIATTCLTKDPQQRPTPAEVIQQCGQATTTAGTADSDDHTTPPPPTLRPARPTTSPGRGTGARPATRTKRYTGQGVPFDTSVIPPHPVTPRYAPTAFRPRRPIRRRTLLTVGAAGAAVLGIVILVSAVLILWPSSPSLPPFPLAATLTGRSSVAFSPDGKTLATSSYDRAVQLWDTASHRQIATLADDDEGIESVAFSPDGKTLASGGNVNGSIRLWDVADRKALATLDDVDSRVDSVVFSPDGHTLATAGINDPEIKLWDVDEHRKVATLTVDETGVGSTGVSTVAFSPDGRTLAVGTHQRTTNARDPEAQLWDVAGHRKIATLGSDRMSVGNVAFSPDGRTLAATIGINTRLWDVASHRQVATLEDDEYGVDGLAFSPDGRTLATSGFRGDPDPADVTVTLWDVPSRRSFATTVTGNETPVDSMAFSPDGRTLATTGPDSVKLWDVRRARSPHT